MRWERLGFSQIGSAPAVPFMDAYSLLVLFIVVTGMAVYLRIVGKEINRRQRHLEYRLDEQEKAIEESNMFKERDQKEQSPARAVLKPAPAPENVSPSQQTPPEGAPVTASPVPAQAQAVEQTQPASAEPAIVAEPVGSS